MHRSRYWIELHWVVMLVMTMVMMMMVITRPLPLREKPHPHSILQVPTPHLAKMSIDPKFVELAADVLIIMLQEMMLMTLMWMMVCTRYA